MWGRGGMGRGRGGGGQVGLERGRGEGGGLSGAIKRYFVAGQSCRPTSRSGHVRYIVLT